MVRVTVEKLPITAKPITVRSGSFASFTDVTKLERQPSPFTVIWNIKSQLFRATRQCANHWRKNFILNGYEWKSGRKTLRHMSCFEVNMQYFALFINLAERRRKLQVHREIHRNDFIKLRTIAKSVRTNTKKITKYANLWGSQRKTPAFTNADDGNGTKAAITQLFIRMLAKSFKWYKKS